MFNPEAGRGPVVLGLGVLLSDKFVMQLCWEH